VGGAGADILQGGAGADTIFGGAGVDTVNYTGAVAGVRVNLNGPPTGGPQPEDVVLGVENVTGGTGGDNIVGNDMANTLNGSGGNDLVFGGLGVDFVFGASGNDSLFGGDGTDRLFGGLGDDVMVGGKGVDRMLGGAGADQFVFGTVSDTGAKDRVLDFVAGEDKLVIGDLPGGGNNPMVTFEVLDNYNILVTVGDLANPTLEIEVTPMGANINMNDIVFSYLG
jgi:Ca2+-binding RTX toxin-like protein